MPHLEHEIISINGRRIYFISTMSVKNLVKTNTINYGDKEVFLKFILTIYLRNLKAGIVSDCIPLFIQNCRDAGYDYPEFKFIEKSNAAQGDAYTKKKKHRWWKVLFGI